MPDGKRRNIGLKIAAAVGVASGLLWLGAIIAGLAGYESKASDYLTDRTFPNAAEPICAATMKRVEAFPDAHLSPTPAARAKVINETTGLLSDMLVELRKVVPATADAKWIRLWISDWEVHLDDRSDFAKRLTEPEPEKAEFFESPKGGGQVSKSVSQFAELNEMPSCATPGDV
jgi:hypothetical protein